MVLLGFVALRMVNLVLEYGSVTLQGLMTQALNCVSIVTRVSQNTYHMKEALMISITRELRQRIIIDIDKARVNDIGNVSMMCKLIMLECLIDTPATMMRLRKKFLTLDHYMVTVQGNVDKFNQYVRNLNIVLWTKGKHTQRDT